jgi:hypothetical protein
VPEAFTSTAGKMRLSARNDDQAELHVAGALELLEDDLVHLGTGLHERGRDDGERAAIFDVARSTEERLGG